jgi:hypothetical protein
MGVAEASRPPGEVESHVRQLCSGMRIRLYRVRDHVSEAAVMTFSDTTTNPGRK